MDDGYLSNKEFEEIKKVFYSQSYEIIESLQELLLGLESDPGDGDVMKSIRRHVHTLKGDSNSFGVSEVGTLCHRMEDVLAMYPENAVRIGRDAVDLLLNCIDEANRLLVESEAGGGATGTKEILDRIAQFILKGRQQEDLSADPSAVVLSEYQDLQVRDALQRGLKVHEIEVVFHPLSEKGMAAFMSVQRLGGMGFVIGAYPDPEGPEIEAAQKMTVLLGSSLDCMDIRDAATMNGMIKELNIREFAGAEEEREPPQQQGRPETPFSALKRETLLVDVAKVDHLMDLVGELIIGRSVIGHISKDVADSDKAEIESRLSAASAQMERTVSDLQKGVMKMRMVPVNHVFRKFPKIVRSLSEMKGKKVRIEICGTETELDKGIVDSLGEPIAHVVRNCFEHGIEDAGRRAELGKPEEGVIRLRAYHQASQIIIEISDDGAGIDTKMLREKAAGKGVLSAGEADALTDSAALDLIFLSGISTSECVSEISGRGVGMEAVKSAIESMKGTVEVESAPGKGSLFRFRLPLTLTIIKGLLFRDGGRVYAVPISGIGEVVRVAPDEIRTIRGLSSMVLRSRTVSLIRMHEETAAGPGKKFALILEAGNRGSGLLVDELLGQQELVVKSIDGSVAPTELVSGASILGDGRVVLIVDAASIFRKAVDEEMKRTVAA